MSDNTVGYKKPPKNRQFGQPNGNSPGATSEQRQREIKNANKATIIREKILDGVLKDIGNGKDVAELIEAAVLKLLLDTENRGLGAPKVTVESDVTHNVPKGLDEFYSDEKE